MENLKYKLQEIKNSLGGRQFLALLLFLVVLFAIPLTVYLVKQRQELRSKADVGSVVLSFGANNLGEKAPGEEFASLDIVLSAGEHNITGVDIIIEFDNTLEAVRFEPEAGNFDYTVIPSNRRASVNNIGSSRSVRYVAVNKGANTKSGTFKLGSIQFKAAAATSGEAKIRFSDAHAVSSGRVEELEVTKDSTVAYIVQGASVSPSPSGRKAGDANDDTCVNIADYNIWKQERQSQTAKCADWVGEAGNVPDKASDVSDFGVWYREWQNPSNRENCIVPAPNTCLNQN